MLITLCDQHCTKTSLSSDTITGAARPQVRYVFENAVEVASVPALDPKPLGEELPQAAGTATRAASEPSLQIDASAQDVLSALHSVTEYQGNEVATICRFTQCCIPRSLLRYLHVLLVMSFGHVSNAEGCIRPVGSGPHNAVFTAHSCATCIVLHVTPLGQVSNAEVYIHPAVAGCWHEPAHTQQANMHRWRNDFVSSICAWVAGLMQMRWQPRYRILEQCRQQLLSSEVGFWMLTVVSVV